MDVFDDRVCQLGEGPFYDDRTGRVCWVDIFGSRLLWRDLSTGETGAVPVPAHLGAAVPRTGGGLVLCLPDGPVLADPDGTLLVLGPYPGQGEGMRSNDAQADPAGRLFLGTMAYDQTPGAGTLYRLDPGATAPVPALPGVTVSNGMGWTADATRMYYIDTPTQRIDIFDYDIRSGTLHDRRPFVTVDGPGFPDGMCVDAEDAVWVALWGGGTVRRYLADGTLDRVVPVPTPLSTSCAFAGPELDLLIVTTAAQGPHAGLPGAGQTYAHRPGDVVGRSVNRYAA